MIDVMLDITMCVALGAICTVLISLSIFGIVNMVKYFKEDE